MWALPHEYVIGYGLLLIAPFPDLCLLEPFFDLGKS